MNSIREQIAKRLAENSLKAEEGELNVEKDIDRQNNVALETRRAPAAVRPLPAAPSLSLNVSHVKKDTMEALNESWSSDIGKFEHQFCI